MSGMAGNRERSSAVTPDMGENRDGVLKNMFSMGGKKERGSGTTPWKGWKKE